MAPKTTKQVTTPEPEAETPKENPRTTKSRERLAFACAEIKNLLSSGDWVSSNEIHKALSGKISEGMFGRAKSELKIEHRRVKGANGKAEYQWRLPASA